MTTYPAIDTGNIVIRRGDTLSLDVEKLGDVSGRANLWFTVKDDKSDADTSADVQIDETTGLLYIAGTAAATPGNGSIVVTDATLGNLTITLAAVESAKLTDRGRFHYDIQMLAGAVVTTPKEALAVVTGDVTLAVS